ncbi:helix-turn-helix domain-containing protein [Thermodesulfobacteriota bacterium]
MSLWRRGNKGEGQDTTEDNPQEKKATRQGRGPAVAMEIKLLAIEALESGMIRAEIGELVGVGVATLDKWKKLYNEGGVEALRRTPSSTGVRERCKVIETRIVAQRREHPEYGVRRIRDELRRDEGISVSAEKVRTTLNEAGLGNPPPTPKRKPPQIRRFERACPNALWQIDIFTFQLKRMYPVYLIGRFDHLP